ncbi:MAG: hypothetical protein ABR981_02430 [Candidatus Micrarchaeaceae archaeon]|jgi:Na+/phosphate symporter
MTEKKLFARVKEYIQKRKTEELKKLLRQEQVLERYERILRKKKDYLTGPVIAYKLEDTKQRIKELAGV